jgi:disulfide oxidoreductase YuzD
MLSMMFPIVIQIVGAPVACADGVKDAWRETAIWAADQLKARYGDNVQVEYFDLFDPACPPLPPDAQLPLVLVNAELLSSGGKISLPAIRKRLEAFGLKSESSGPK